MDDGGHPLHATPPALTRDDFCPLSEFQFQHWHERPGAPFDQIRPLTDLAAERMWARAMP